MIPCVVGIGGCGGKVLKEFLRNQDVTIRGKSLGEHLSFCGIKGVWLDSATMDAQKENFYGRLEDGSYPGYLIPPEVIKDNSKIFDYVADNYGYDLKSAGFDRRAEYLKAVFEIFETDEKLKDIARDEYQGEDNPIQAYIWKRGIRPYTILSLVSNDAKEGASSALKAQRSLAEEPEGMTRGDEASKIGEVETLPSSSEKSEGAQSKVRAKNPLKMLEGLSSLVPKKTNNGTNGSNNNGSAQGLKLCDSILFIASLGGGTGTGFINPVTSYVRSEQPNFPAFVLGVLTEKGTDDRGTHEGQRDLGAVIAMYDLLTKRVGRGVDGLILVDNEILLRTFEKNYPAINRAIFDIMKPFIELRNYPDVGNQGDSLAMKRVFLEGLKLPPVLVPCYCSQKRAEGSEGDLVKKALYGQDGGLKLFDCDPKRADMAYVFTRGFVHTDKVRRAVHDHTGLPDNEKRIMVYRKIGDHGSDEMLILLRNPYGEDPEAYKKEGTFENRVYGIVDKGLKYLDEKENDIILAGMPDDTKIALGTYFYGESWLDKMLKELDGSETNKRRKKFKKKLTKAKSDLESEEVQPPTLLGELEKSKSRLEMGNTPAFLDELNIFTRDKVVSATRELDMAQAYNNGESSLTEKEIRDIVKSEIDKMIAAGSIKEM